MNNNYKNAPILPKQQRSIASKKKILESAEMVFSQKGLHGARIDEIAKLASINKQRIYAYFGSKKQLYRHVLLKIYSQAAENHKILELSEDDAPVLTRKILEAFFDFHENYPLFWRLLTWENLNGTKTLNASDWENIQSSYVNHIKKLYLNGQNSGLICRKIDFGSYLLLVFSVTYFYYSNQMTISNLLNLKLDNKKIKDTIANQIDFIINRGIKVIPEGEN